MLFRSSSFGRTYDTRPDRYLLGSFEDTITNAGPIKWLPDGVDPESLKGFRFDGSELPGWALQRVQLDERAQPPVLRSLWSRGDTMSALLAIDVFECASVRGAHEQLLEALGNIESDTVERRTAPNAPGDVAFALAAKGDEREREIRFALPGNFRCVHVRGSVAAPKSFGVAIVGAKLCGAHRAPLQKNA